MKNQKQTEFILWILAYASNQYLWLLLHVNTNTYTVLCVRGICTSINVDWELFTHRQVLLSSYCMPGITFIRSRIMTAVWFDRLYVNNYIYLMNSSLYSSRVFSYEWQACLKPNNMKSTRTKSFFENSIFMVVIDQNQPFAKKKFKWSH